MNERQLLQLKEKIQENKEEKARLEGKITHLFDELVTEFGCKTLQEAETLLEGKEEEIISLQDQLDELVEVLTSKTTRNEFN